MVLSGRLQMLADMVTPGSVLADVGCDHGFLSIYLVQAGVCPRAVAMDVRKGPLAGAGKHIEEYGLGDYIETRLSDGLAECSVGEFGAVVCAGMGGRLMERILTEGREKLQGVRELILQPQSELGEFRAFLRRAGYVLVQEDAVFEEGKYYFAMKACPDNSSAAGSLTAENGESARRREELADRFGGLLLEAAHPVLLGYLRQREAHLRQGESSLGAADSRRAEEALAGIRRELTDIELAYEICGSGRGEGSSPA